jgi:hypothetical protein
VEGRREERKSTYAAVDVLQTGDHLVGEHEDSLEGEFAVADVEEVLEGGSEEVHDHNVVVALHAVEVDVGDADAALEDLVELGLVEELRMFRVRGLQLDGDLLMGGEVDSGVDFTKGATTDLLAEAVLIGYPQLHGQLETAERREVEDEMGGVVSRPKTRDWTNLVQSVRPIGN